MAEKIVWLRGLAPARKRSGLTLQTVADALDVSRQAVSQWETGTAWPTPDRLPRLAEVLGCTIDELYTGGRVVEDAGPYTEEL